MQTKSVYLALDDSITALNINRTLQLRGIGNIKIFSKSETLFNAVMYTSPPDLIIADTSISDRIDLYKSIEKIWGKLNVPVLFIASDNSELDARNYDKTKYFSIKKPFTGEILLEGINRFLKSTQMTS
jgi:two-component SAPR family response regulator